MKVLITTLNSKYSHTNIALYYLKNSIKNLCQTYTHNFTINDNIESIVDKIIEYDCDIVGFGCYIWNIEQTLKIAESLKILKPNIIIIFGGPEVSYNPKEILKKYDFINTVICGEGEINMQLFIKDAYNKDIKKIYNTPINVEDIPDITDDIIDNYDNRVIYFETSRGCPYRCSYCLSCIDKNIKYFDIDKVEKNLKKLLDKNVQQIRFIDRTFNSDRKRALRIWKYLINNRKQTTFHFEICVNLIDEETLNFLKTVPNNIFQFEIGIQSTNEKTLNAINRAYNFPKERILIQKLVEYGNIKLHTDLIIGLPYEDFNTFKKSFNDLYILHTDELQLGFLKFLKGTTIYLDKDKFGYKYNQYPPYEVLENSFISYNEIRFLKRFEDIFESYYNSGFFKNTFNYLNSKYTIPFDLFEKITNYYISNNLFNRKISTDESFYLLTEIFKADKDIDIIRQALTYDYFLKFNGTRDWFYNKYSNEILKEKINNYIKESKDTLFNNSTIIQIHKEYKFCILDYDFINNEKCEGKLYISKK